MWPLIGAAFVGVVTAHGVWLLQSGQRPPQTFIARLRHAQKNDETMGQPSIVPCQPQQVRAPDVAETEEPDDATLNRHLMVSGVALGTTCMGYFFYAPLGILTTPLIIYLEWPIYQAAWRDLVEKRGVKIDGLMALFTTAAWLTRAYVSSAFSIFTLAFADKIITQTQDRSRQKLIQLFDQQPRMVWLWVDGSEVETPFQTVQAGDRLVVYAGQIMPVDGVVVAGMATVDQQRLTGEARLVEKGVGDAVLAATLVVRGQLQVRVEKAGRATLAVQIAELLNQTTAYHLAVAERGLALAEKFVLPSLLISALALPLCGFSSAVAVLSAMPGVDMHFAGPLALLNFLHLAAQQGILVKDGRSLELLHTIDTVVFDKTGTLTLEQPQVAHIHQCGEWSAAQILRYAAAAEHRQSHPIAQAILAAAQERNLTVPDVTGTRYEAGYGVQVCVDDQQVRVGSERFMHNEKVVLPPAIQQIQQHCAELGHSLVFVAVADALVGVLELQPTLRPEVQAVITDLNARKLTLYILSGDQAEPTRHLAAQAGIAHYFANVLPADKSRFVEHLQQAGRKVCFVGDGINDALALKQANVSISLRGATTIATDTAQIVLMEQSLRQLPLLFDLAHRLERNLLTSFGLSVGTGVVIMGGALALQMSIGTAVGFGAVALLGIVGNAMAPLLFTLQKQESTRVAAQGTPGVIFCVENDGTHRLGERTDG